MKTFQFVIGFVRSSLQYMQQQQNPSNSVAHIIHIILVRGIIQDQSHSVIQFALDRSELRRAFEEFDEVYRRSSDAIFLLYPSL